MAEADDELKRLTLVHNEKTKLSATYMNGVAVAVLAVGGLAPFFTALTSARGGLAVPPIVVISSLGCWLTTGAIHWGARRQLRSLR